MQKNLTTPFNYILVPHVFTRYTIFIVRSPFEAPKVLEIYNQTNRTSRYITGIYIGKMRGSDANGEAPTRSLPTIFEKCMPGLQGEKQSHTVMVHGFSCWSHDHCSNDASSFYRYTFKVCSHNIAY